MAGVGDGNILPIGGLMERTLRLQKKQFAPRTLTGARRRPTGHPAQANIIQSNETWKQDLRDMRQRLDGYRCTPSRKAGRAVKDGGQAMAARAAERVERDHVP